MIIRRNYLAALIVVPLFVCIASLFFAPLHFAGDQGPYTDAYKSLSGLPLSDAYVTYFTFIGSKEPTHFFIIWLANLFEIEKNPLMATINGLFAFFLMQFFKKLRVSVFIASFICITNFYIIVLYFSSERLKFGVILLILSAYYNNNNNNRKSYGFSFLAITTHIQLIIIYSALLMPKIFSGISLELNSIKIKKQRLIILKFALFLIAASIIFQFLGDHIFGKYEYYSAQQKDRDNFLIFSQAILIFGMTFLYSKKKSEICLKFIPIFIAIFLLGGENVNIFAYIIFMSYALTYNRGVNFGVLTTSTYFAFKSFNFIILTINTGQGI